MKKLVTCLIALAIIGSTSFIQAKTLDQYMEEAQGYQTSNNLDQAITTMKEAVKEYPDNSDAYTQLGIYMSNKAQRMQNFSEMLQLTEKVFLMWDKAISLDPNNVTARFYRGAWGVMIPKFTGRLETGIGDLEYIVNMFEQSTDMDAQAQLVYAYQYLATGYQKKGELSKARQFYEKVIEINPGTEDADNAQKGIDRIALFEEWQAEQDKDKKADSPEIIDLKGKIEKEPYNIGFLVQLGKAYFNDEKYVEAKKVLRKAVNFDPSNLHAYKLLALTLEEISEEEYDPRISLDTDFRTDLAFEAMNVLDKIVFLAPENIEMRFHRGVTGVQMPFFVGKLDQSIDDLIMVMESDFSESMNAEALYWLGRAHQKKAMSYWIEVISEYPNYDASQFVFDNLNPAVKRIDPTEYKKPIVIIDFVLGFRDELAPQTAVWIENKDGKFIKTVYVSGFSGYAKDQQINLPMWSASSKFIDVDGVTGASIDLGHHIYVWDTKDESGKKIKSGDYIINVEVAYWPSKQYQRVKAPITLGKKDKQAVIKEGNLIPYLEIKYIR